jgi:predicted anti-sigma-YlaC factor YlaD
MIDSQMRCVELVELVTDWMEDALDDVTLSRLEEHLVICPPCSRYVTQIGQSARLLRTLDTEAPPPEARRELLEMFRAQRDG